MEKTRNASDRKTLINKLISLFWSIPFVWFALSYFDTMAHQSTGSMAVWNLFNIIIS